MIYKDSYIEIGSEHEICEDYVITGSLDDYHYAIVCDGCSSSNNTDVGARIIAHCARRVLQEIQEINFHHIEVVIVKKLKQIAEILNFDSHVFDATLILAIVKDNQYDVAMWGDGAIIERENFNHSKGCLTRMITRVINYSSQAPFYLSYQLDDERVSDYSLFAKYVNKISDKTILTLYNENQLVMDELDSLSFYSTSGTLAENMSLTIATDGIGSFNNKTPFQMADEMTAYKNYKGEFVKRRMKKIKRENQKEDINHYDDIACATIYRDSDESSD